VPSFGQQNTQAIDQTKLIGRWISMDDEKYEIIFDTASQHEYYDKDLLNEHAYKLVGNTLVLKDKRTSSVYNYSVVDLTTTRLTLLYQDRGNLLRFNKSSRQYRKAQEEVSKN
jgi:hypothetical protein